jgi:lysophospholipase L1-like esterase
MPTSTLIPQNSEYPILSLRVATFGDSTADFGTVRTGSVTDQQVCDIPVGTTTTSVSRNTTKWQLNQFYPPARLVANGGIGGETTTQMIAREAAASSTTRKSILDVVNLSPDIVLLRAGSINDLIAFTYPATEIQYQALLDRHMQIVDTFISNGIRVLDEGIAGYDATNFANIRPALIEMNSRIKSACQASRARLDFVKFLDPVGLTCSSTGAYITGCTNDGIHLSYYGQYRLANSEAAVLTDWFGEGRNVSFSGTNLMGSTSQFPTSSVVAYGTVPTGFSWSATQCTRQNAAIAQRYGRRFAMCEAVASGATPSLQVVLPFGIWAAGSPQIPIVATGQYSVEVTVFVESLDGSPLLGRVLTSSRLDIRNGSSGRLVIDSTPGSNTGNSAYTESLIVENISFPVWQASEGSATLANTSAWSLDFNFSQTQSIRAGISAPKIIRINQRAATQFTDTVAATGATYTSQTLVGAQSINLVILNGTITQPPFTFNPLTGTITIAVAAGDKIYVSYTP